MTHSLYDHIYGINALHRAYPECRVYTTEYGVVALYDEKKIISKYHELPFVYEGTEVIVLNDDESIELYPGIGMKVYSTPVHCPSRLIYIVGN